MTEPTRQQILDAAAKVYAELGFRGATTRRIAEVAGVNEVTLFRTFGSKANLIDEVIRSCHRDPDAASLPAEPAEPEAELTRWVAETHRFMLDRRGLIRSAVAELHEHPEHSNEVADHPTVSFRELRAYVDRVHRTGAIPDVANANAACTMLLGTLFSDALHRDVMPSMFPPAPDAPRTYVRLFLRALGATAAVGLAILLIAAAPMRLAAQGGVAPTATAPTATSAPATLSLLDALRRAEQKSEGVAIAAAGVTRAKGVQQQANSARLPQANGSIAYQRAIQNQFASISERFSDPNDTTSGGGFTDSPIARIFAAPNTAIFSLNVSQTLYSAGRIPAARAGAAAGRTAAEIAYDAAKAQAVLEVAQAYFDAVAADQFVAIAESSLVLTDRALAQVTLAREVGTAAEFDLIRAQVARDNQRPLVIQAAGARTAAYLRLKQLLDLPLTGPLTLTTPIRDEVAAAASPTAPIVLADARTVQPDTAVSARATVRQAEAQVRAQEGALRAAKLARLPALQLSSTYQRFAYPPEGTFLPSALDLYFPNWNVTLGLSVPVLTGGRLRGERLVAEANLTEARERLQQSREGASVDALLTISQYEQAQAAYAASVGTDTQAQRAYAIAEVRFREGLSTSLELTQVRVQLEQARLQRVTAARDLEVARLRLALLKDLPLPLQGGR
ncbi:MAG: TolC family protein [Gemmatimonadetes bacterium]|nr:TolC family protein [Gemmatimonadota bacterium]